MSTRCVRTLQASVVLTGLLLAPAYSASPDAWEEVTVDVRQACEAQALANMLKPEKIVVDAVGSEDYGMAVVFGRVANVDDMQMVICVYSKSTKVAQIGTQLNIAQK